MIIFNVFDGDKIIGLEVLADNGKNFFIDFNQDVFEDWRIGKFPVKDGSGSEYVRQPVLFYERLMNGK